MCRHAPGSLGRRARPSPPAELVADSRTFKQEPLGGSPVSEPVEFPLPLRVGEHPASFVTVPVEPPARSEGRRRAANKRVPRQSSFGALGDSADGGASGGSPRGASISLGGSDSVGRARSARPSRAPQRGSRAAAPAPLPDADDAPGMPPDLQDLLRKVDRAPHEALHVRDALQEALNRQMHLQKLLHQQLQIQRDLQLSMERNNAYITQLIEVSAI